MKIRNKLTGKTREVATPARKAKKKPAQRSVAPGSGAGKSKG